MDLYILLVSLLFGWTAAADAAADADACSDVDYATMQDEYKECAANYKHHIQQITRSSPSTYYQHIIQKMIASSPGSHISPLATYIERLTCDYLDIVVADCGKVLERCNDEDSIGRTVEDTLEQLVVVGGQYSHKCDVLRVLRKSRSQQKEKDIQERKREACTESNKWMAKQEMDRCTDTATVVANSKLENITYPNTFSSILCNALRFVGTECFRDLQMCLSYADVKKMKIDQINHMKNYFLQLAEGKIDQHSLDACQFIQTDERNNEEEMVKSPTLSNEYDEYYIRSSDKKDDDEVEKINSKLFCSKDDKKLADLMELSLSPVWTIGNK